jgi:hypothetical protein
MSRVYKLAELLQEISGFCDYIQDWAVRTEHIVRCMIKF